MVTANERILKTYIEDEIKGSYIDYAMSVIVGRALPDVRDGLKPVHRRILYAMHDIGLTPGKPYKKSAAVVGEVLAKYHPHGDSSVYDTMVRMVQDFSLRYPLIDGQGNFGSVDGDSAAAYRYTEARLDALAIEMLRDIEKDTVKFTPNFDESTKEPSVLPALLPNLLVNGSVGIAVGMATNIPPHNLTEVCNALVTLIDNPDSEIKDLVKHITGPDFPTGAIIYGRQGIKEMYETGRGHLTLRARASMEEAKGGKERIIISEIPYQVNKTAIIERIAALVRDKKLEGISDLRDESDREGMRLVIELKRDATPLIVLNNLYKHTQLQTTFGVIMLALVDGKPEVLNLKRICECYLKHRQEVIVRRTKFDLAKAEERAHILEGLKIALAHLDEVIALIKKSKDPEIAKEGLMKKFKLSERQAIAILQMQLQRLTGLEVKKLDEEYRGLIELINELKSILTSPKKVLAIIRKELVDLKEKFGDGRRTELIDKQGEFKVEDLIADENVVITISHAGYIKRMPVQAYRAQRRGGQGVYGMDTKEEDFVEHLFVASTHNYILFFTSLGTCHWLKVYDIPQGSKTSRGKAIINLLALAPDSKVSAFVPIRKFEEERCLIMVTRDGVVKKTDLMAFSNPRRAGIRTIALKPKDQLVEVLLTDGKQEVVIASRHGMAIRFHESIVRTSGRGSGGVRGMRLEEKDEVVGMVVVRPTSSLLSATENGFGKQTPLTEYRVTNRGGKGVTNIKTNERNGKVVCIKEVVDGDEIIIVTRGGIVIRTGVDGIRETGRSAQGVILIKLAENDKIIDITRVVSERREASEVGNGNGNGDSAPASEDAPAAEPVAAEETAVEEEPAAKPAREKGKAARPAKVKAEKPAPGPDKPAPKKVKRK